MVWVIGEGIKEGRGECVKYESYGEKIERVRGKIEEVRKEIEKGE